MKVEGGRVLMRYSSDKPPTHRPAALHFPPEIAVSWVPTATGTGVVSATGTTDVSNYDIIGRRYYLGVNAKF